MDESVFASGVDNIKTSLCTFPAGIVEGFLNEATDDSWNVIETKCVASGDSKCEFQCRVRG